MPVADDIGTDNPADLHRKTNPGMIPTRDDFDRASDAPRPITEAPHIGPLEGLMTPGEPDNWEV
jgi:hypothetical protein